MTWHVPIEHLAQQPFALRPPDLHVQGETPRELHDAMVQKGHARFERYAHGRSIYFAQEVVRQIANLVHKHQFLLQRNAVQPFAGVSDYRWWFGSGGHDSIWRRPQRNELAVDGRGMRRSKDAS